MCPSEDGGGTHGRVLHEVQSEAGDSQPGTGNIEEWQASHTRNVPGMWDKSNPDREGIASYDDIVTGGVIEVKVGSLFTRLSVNGRDYYFDRITGRFAGTGQGCF